MADADLRPVFDDVLDVPETSLTQEDVAAGSLESLASRLRHTRTTQ